MRGLGPAHRAVRRPHRPHCHPRPPRGAWMQAAAGHHGEVQIQMQERARALERQHHEQHEGLALRKSRFSAQSDPRP